MMFPLLLFILIPLCFVVFNFVHHIIKGNIKTNEKLFRIFQIWTVVLVPLFFIINFDLGQINECCTDSALFSPEHRIGIYTLLIAYTLFYCVSILKKSNLPPLVELITNSFLILGLIINVMLCIHIHKTELGVFLWAFGNMPILLLLLLELDKNHKRLRLYIEENKLEFNNSIGKLSLSILKLQPLLKFPILTLILVPILILLSLFLFLFGQKPDSFIRAFTDTYNHGFSQLDHLCDNVQCGGHFLCSVGANGHKSIVKPIRYGERHGNKIICNRQLLISNAFEGLVEERLPKTHKVIRKAYNNVGNVIHKHYHIFNIKLVSDVVYIFMKPLELVFLLILYTFDAKPENRIAIQYLNKNDKKRISVLKTKTAIK